VKKIAATWIALVCGVLDTVQAAPELKMDLPDWGKTPVRDRDLGHGVHMLESFGGNIGVLAASREYFWWMQSGRSSMPRCAM
jgi:hypothetical protein